MNILVLNWQDLRNPFAGGAEVHLHEIFSRLVKRGHTVTLFCSSFQGAKEKEIIDGITIIRKGQRNLFNFYVPIYYFKYFRKQNFDVVIDDINKIPFYTPLFVRKPLVGIVLHLFQKSIFLEVGFLSASYVYLAERLISPVYKKTPLMVLSESTENDLVKMGLSKKRFTIVGGGVDFTKYKKSDIQKSSTPLIGCLGRIKKYKSVDHAIQAFAIVKRNIPNAQFLIVGDGDYKPELEKLVQQLHLEDSVEFTGFVSEEEKVRLLQQMHVVVQPSAKEGWGLTVIEANACGTTCVASNVHGLREALSDNETGFLFEYGNVEQLAEKVFRLLSDEKLRLRFELNGLEWAKKFDWEKITDDALHAMKKSIEVKK